MRNKKINIAIDGFSASGKSTIARKLAKKMNYVYLDTGSMYRTVTFYFLRNTTDISSQGAIKEALKNIQIKFKSFDGINHVFLNGTDVSEEIRDLKVSENVSRIAEISEVRKFLVKQQKEIAKDKGVIMDGRDIGTVVMPDAEIKIYLTTDEKIRITRRLLELQQKGIETSYDEIKTNIRTRDITDSTREDSPLRIAENAFIIDNSKEEEQEVIDFIFALAQTTIQQLSAGMDQLIK